MRNYRSIEPELIRQSQRALELFNSGVSMLVDKGEAFWRNSGCDSLQDSSRCGINLHDLIVVHCAHESEPGIRQNQQPLRSTPS
jgi:hypothetical protein